MRVLPVITALLAAAIVPAQQLSLIDAAAYQNSKVPDAAAAIHRVQGRMNLEFLSVRAMPNLTWVVVNRENTNARTRLVNAATGEVVVPNAQRSATVRPLATRIGPDRAIRSALGWRRGFAHAVRLQAGQNTNMWAVQILDAAGQDWTAHVDANSGVVLRVLPTDQSWMNLVGPVWQLTEIQGMDDSLLKIEDPSKYTIQFYEDGGVAVRADVNRGRTQIVPGATLQFGPMALTMMMPPDGSHHDRFVRELSFVRSFVTRGGNLFLATKADGSIMKFVPARR